ncbi:SEL1-like repeat protein [Psychromarinibacter sp. C21-152]|uniref:SEL1-like repeat protein n=1 Tax=Psychromarinibacter sediminicola TaxID=3033385 RepID=A0AAE3NW91_9RHOB|nr:SEL1-like repeat protein [Psychromarinibacter sediminicola]MDF0603266.1 SEL1-like repeat protein [Psychromarinibacter sediminicola]
MPLRRPFRIVASLALAAAASVAAVPAQAAEDDPRMQLLVIGASPEAGLEGGLSGDRPIIAIDALPEAGDVKQEVFAARLRANPVSTFVSTPSDEGKQFEQFFLVARAALEPAGGNHRLSLGRAQFSMEDFAGRLGSAVQAFDPRHRRIGFLHIVDPADAFPRALPELQTALGGLGFDMMVLMIEGEGAACDTAQPLHYSLMAGLADRAPFGNADGASTVAEVESYLTGALARADARDCGPTYSLILKSGDDPNRVVVEGAMPPFVEMETRLYHETFEAMFLLESEDADTVHAFLESCVYCPREAELTGRLKAMEDTRRTAALEGEIWERIKADDTRERLAIYVENCALCEHRAEALARIDRIDAKAAAFERERKDFMLASEARDLPALRAYAADCVACTHKAEAEALISEIEADTAYMAERALLAEAVEMRDPLRLDEYLKTCTVCDGQDEVARTMEVLVRLKEVRDPCLKLAGLPQHDGPRKLEDIDQAQATAACAAALEEFPEDGLLRTTMGRIKQAAGDVAAAKAAYAFGMDREVPAAYGLAAYSHYAPTDGSRVDLDKVEELASTGAELGDWLSHEILTVIYSKDLVPGKSGEDAFDIAARIAEEGNPLAQFFVGYYYLTGTGTEPSDSEAEAWLKKAVDQGYTHAYSFLAELHERGTDGTPRPDMAADLYWAALEQGDPTATDRLTTQLNNRDREVVRIIQAKLREAGLYRGRVDGVAGPGTVSAIREYADTLKTQG